MRLGLPWTAASNESQKVCHSSGFLENVSKLSLGSLLADVKGTVAGTGDDWGGLVEGGSRMFGVIVVTRLLLC